jgi:tail assembly chaperone
MAKLSLVADPTFDAMVPVPVASGPKPVLVRMTFKHRTRSELTEFYNSIRPDVSADDAAAPDPDAAVDKDTDAFMQCVTAWELTDEFTRENVRMFLNNYFGAARATFETYSKSLQGERLGN